MLEKGPKNVKKNVKKNGLKKCKKNAEKYAKEMHKNARTKMSKEKFKKGKKISNQLYACSYVKIDNFHLYKLF